MARQRTSLEKTMSERRNRAAAEVEKKHPNPQKMFVSYFGAAVVVDVKDAKGAWHRYRHHDVDDFLGAELANVGVERREVRHG